MTWEFKRSLYCSAQKISLRACSDLSSPAVQARLQAHFDSAGGFPQLDAPGEYALYFEAAYPSEADRRRYIEEYVAFARPSYGHIALAALMKLEMTRLIWTTNFDRLAEDAAFDILGGSSRVVVATLDNANTARDAVDESRWPLIVKLHGDFQSRRLKNTSDEIRSEDAVLRACLVERRKRQGLAVVGYSGRDDSVMAALEEGLGTKDSPGYPFGLFWFCRSDAPDVPRIQALITKATDLRIEAELIRVETFDELLADIFLLIRDVPADLAARLGQHPRRVSDAPLPPSQGIWPVLRLNALLVAVWPAQCRRVVCTIGGVAEVRNAVVEAGADLIVGRRRTGVLAFGSDSQIRKAFDKRNITELDVYSIEARCLGYESAELGMLYDALGRALARERGLLIKRRRSALTAYVAVDSNSDRFGELGEAVGSLVGTIPGTTLKWAEAVDLKLEYRLDRVFLLFEPTVWADSTLDDKMFEFRRNFLRERRANRYNQVWNKLFDAWAVVIVGNDRQGELRAFGISDGVDAMFTICRTTAFSWRAP